MRERRFDFIFEVALWFIGAAFLGPLLLLGYQFFLWLKDGFWTPIPIMNIFVLLDWNIPTKFVFLDTEWKGIHKIVLWILDLHMGVAVFGVAMIIGILVWCLFAVLVTLIGEDEELSEF